MTGSENRVVQVGLTYDEVEKIKRGYAKWKSLTKQTGELLHEYLSKIIHKRTMQQVKISMRTPWH